MDEPKDPLQSIMDLDRLIHEPARLVILTALSEAESAEFLFLEKITGLSRGNLSAQCQKLEAAGYLQIDKAFRGRRPVTTMRITPEGLQAIGDYRTKLKELLDR
jgi:DNA-binding MarR family transcriptional regulator